MGSIGRELSSHTFGTHKPSLFLTGVCVVYMLVWLMLFVFNVQFDGVHIVSGSLDTHIRVWKAETGQCLHTLKGMIFCSSGTSYFTIRVCTCMYM